MDTTQTLPTGSSPVTLPGSPKAAKLFHAGTAALLLGLMVLGFQQFYLHGRAYPGRELTPPIRTLIILHGVAMAGWMLLFLLQPLLVATGNRRIHMKLGWLGAGIAVAVVILGLRLGIESTRVNPAELRIWGLPPKQFMAVPVISIAIFGGFVAAGIGTRRRPEVHRAMLLLATLAAMPAAISRIDALNHLYHETIWEKVFGPFFMTLVIAVLLGVVKWAVTRKVDRYYWMGCLWLIISSALIMGLAPTAAWDQFASFLLR